MPQRLALAAAAVAATVVLAVGLVAAGFAPVPAGQPAAASLEQPASDLEAEQSLEPEVVYVQPAPTPKTIVLEQRAQATRSGSTSSRTTTVRSEEREHEAEERDERREDEREERAERRKEAAERAGERREREDDDD